MTQHNRTVDHLCRASTPRAYPIVGAAVKKPIKDRVYSFSNRIDLELSLNIVTIKQMIWMLLRGAA